MHGGALHMLGHLKEVWPLLITAIIVTAILRIAIGGILRIFLPPDILQKRRPEFFSRLRRFLKTSRNSHKGEKMGSLYLVTGLAVFCFTSLMTSLYFIMLAILRRFTGDGKPLPEWKIYLRNFCYVLSVIILICGVWSFIEPYRPKIKHVEIQSGKIHSPVKIVQVSDFHCDEVMRAEPLVVKLVRQIKPDIILFTGDGINSLEGLPNFTQTIRQLVKIAPVYGVRGNWEVWWFSGTDIFGPDGMVDVANKKFTLDIRGNSITLCGAEVDDESSATDMINSLDEGDFNIFLHHYPAAWRLADGKADLHLAGDTHGGQIQIPFIGPLIKMKRVDNVYYHDGLQRPEGSENISLYVNHGIGMEGGATPRVRFNCPPEVTEIDLRPVTAN